jgi:hypothetical protein
MREHAERVQLSRSVNHLRIYKGCAALGHLGAVHQNGRTVAHARFFFEHQPQGFLAGRQFRAEQRGTERLQREPLDAIDHRRLQIFVAQPRHPSRQLPAHRHAALGCCRAVSAILRSRFKVVIPSAEARGICCCI